MGSLDITRNRPRIPQQSSRVQHQNSPQRAQQSHAARTHQRSNHPALRAHRGNSDFTPGSVSTSKGARPPMVQQGGTFEAKGTGYRPVPGEGGPTDRLGKPLSTLQDFLEGKSDHVSVAMDSKAFPYDSTLNCKQLDEQYADRLKQLGVDHIPFKVVDTGGDFKNTGTSRIDICTRSRDDAHENTINGQLNFNVVDTPGFRPPVDPDTFRG
jgi:hypothetical protein